MNEEDKLQALFDNFKPQMPSGEDFMERLQRQMDAVDMVKELTKADVRRSHIAMVIAFVCGIAVGIGSTIALTHIDVAGTIASLISGLHLGAFATIIETPSLITGSLAAILTVGVGLFTYHTALRHLPTLKASK